MKKLPILLLLALVAATMLPAQKLFTRTGVVTFTSEAPLEKIEARNSKVNSVLDAATGRLEFAVLIKAFQFQKALMQEHFNENYMESDKYPKATFKGTIVENAAVQYTKDGTYKVSVKGDLTMHGVTKPVTVPALLKVKGGVVSAEADFAVLVADYDIKIPAVVKDNIAKEVAIAVRIAYEPLK